jgi:hypothetical protein
MSSGNVPQLEGHTLGFLVPVDGLHAHQVDDAGEVFFSADRQLNRYGIAAQAILDLPDDAQEVRPHAVHLVDEGQTRHAVLVGLTPDGFRLRLDTADGAEDGAGAVEHTQRALHLDGEIHVPRRIDDVDPVLRILLIHALPEAGRRSGRNRDAALLLLLHPVHGGGAVVHLADLVREPRCRTGCARSLSSYRHRCAP